MRHVGWQEADSDSFKLEDSSQNMAVAFDKAKTKTD